MADYHDLVQALTWLLINRLQSKSEYTRGLLGNGQGQVEVPDRPDYTYVRPDRFTTRVAEIFNKTVGGPDGLPVILGELPWSPGLTQVLSVDWDTYLGVGWGDATPGIAQHGQTHEWRDGAPGVDSFNVYRRQMGDLRTYPVGSGSNSVFVSPYNFTHFEQVKSWSGLPGLDLSEALVESGKLYFADGRWDRPSTEELGVPQSVRVAIQARVRVLPADAQETLRLAAVLGREFDFDTLVGASDQDEDVLIDALENAERAQLIEEVSGDGGGTFAFLHALIPTTLVESSRTLQRRRSGPVPGSGTPENTSRDPGCLRTSLDSTSAGRRSTTGGCAGLSPWPQTGRCWQM